MLNETFWVIFKHRAAYSYTSVDSTLSALVICLMEQDFTEYSTLFALSFSSDSNEACWQKPHKKSKQFSMHKKRLFFHRERSTPE
mgnify:CR=1 FL=1